MRRNRNRNKKFLNRFFISIALIIGVILIMKVVSLSTILFGVLFNRGFDLKETNNHVRILGMGRGGGLHEGPDLTDSLILADINTKTSDITLISIPRDLWAPDLKAKVNAAYSQGEERKKGGGLILSKSVISKITGQNVDYVVVVDFSGFTRTVDLLGGIDVEVEKSFNDYEYPIAGKEDDTCGHKPEEVEELATSSSQLEAFPCRYKHIHFDGGVIHMNGETALEFARSRHGDSGEGSDFARSKRQEKIVKALKDKIFSIQLLLNPTKLFSLYGTLKDSIDTDIAQDELDDFIRLGQKLGKSKIQTIVVDSGDSEKNRPGLLTHPPISGVYNYEWVLIPRTGASDYSEIHSYIECEINKGETNAATGCTLSEIQ